MFADDIFRRSFEPRRLALARFCALAPLLAAGILAAQPAPDLPTLAQRLDALERANRSLQQQVTELRQQLAARQEPNRQDSALEEQVALQTERIEEQAQTKVEAAQHFPIRLKGMVLFNSYLNSKQSGGLEYPTVAAHPGLAGGGSGFGQSVIGLDYQGPQIFNGGKVRGSLLMDFYGSSELSPSPMLRMRTATVQVDWKTRTLTAGLDRPIFAPRMPDSLAQVGVAPLTGAGDLWMWIPQVGFSQDFRWSDASSLRAQLGFVQTREVTSYQGREEPAGLEPARPGLEGRFEFSHRFGEERRVAIAPGFHASTTHVAGAAVPSRLVSLDWLAAPWRKLEWTGALFRGRNVAHLGTGGVGDGFLVTGEGQARPLAAAGGWTQLTWFAADRLSFHFFAGQHRELDGDLPAGRIGRNLAWGANFYYSLAPNLIMSMELSQLRSAYIQMGNRLNNHYDLAFAYLF